MHSPSNPPANHPPRRTKTVHFTQDNSSTSNNEPLQNEHQDLDNSNSNSHAPLQHPKPTSKRRRNRALNCIPTMVQNWYTHKEFKIWYIRRVELEHHLLNATIALPNKTGLTEGRIAELERVLERDCKRLPQTEREWERDDLPRVHAVVALIKARHSIGAETDATMEKWDNIAIYKEFDRDSDERKKDIVLVELEKRKDGEWLQRLERHYKYREAISRFFNATVALPNRGGLKKTQISLLSPIFSGNEDRANVIEAWWQRRNALIYILRARKRRGIREEPEINGTWEGYTLPDPASPMLSELCREENEVAWRVDGEAGEMGGEHIGLTPAPLAQELRAIKPFAELLEHELSPMPEAMLRNALRI